MAFTFHFTTGFGEPAKVTLTDPVQVVAFALDMQATTQVTTDRSDRPLAELLADVRLVAQARDWNAINVSYSTMAARDAAQAAYRARWADVETLARAA